MKQLSWACGICGGYNIENISNCIATCGDISEELKKYMTFELVE